MPDNDSISGEISDKDTPYTVPLGYHDGSGTVEIAEAEKAKLIGGNIKQGITILGVSGTYSGESVSAQSKQATPTTQQQVIQPDEGYDYLASVTVLAIPYSETENAAGGKTVTIAGAGA